MRNVRTLRTHVRFWRERTHWRLLNDRAKVWRALKLELTGVDSAWTRFWSTRGRLAMRRDARSNIASG